VAAHGPITADALAARLDLEPSGLSERFAALGREGYVRPDRQGVPDLTAKGRRALVALVRAGHDEVARPARGQAGTEREAVVWCVRPWFLSDAR